MKVLLPNQRRFLLRVKNMRIVVIILAVFIIVLGCMCWKLLQDNASLTIMNLIHQETEKELKERLKDNETTKLP